MTHRDRIGAWDLKEELKADPEWAAKNEAIGAEKRALAAEFAREAKPILDELKAAGFPVSEPGELQTLKKRQAEALEILMRHLDKEYHWRVRDSIIIALRAPFARGEPARKVLEQFRNSHNEHREVRWAMVDVLEIIADKSMVAELEALARVETDADIAQFLPEVVKSASKRTPK